jgi:CheY-like chemotaxis protein
VNGSCTVLALYAQTVAHPDREYSRESEWARFASGPRSGSKSSRPEAGRQEQGDDDDDRPFVLIADDEAVIADTLVEILNSEGFKAVAVNDGAAAVESAHRLRPDIVLADVSMPRMNGVEAAKKIREISPETRIVLFSGHAETAELLARAKREGHSFEVVAKPLNPIALLKVLRA